MPPAPVAAHRSYRIIGYVYRRADISAIGAKKLTHINYAFARVNPLGLVDLDEPDGPSRLAQLQALKAQNPDLKIIVSVGGWGADYFSDAALTEGSRCRFADSAVDLLKRYALDGIDLDWEYPGSPGPGMIFRTHPVIARRSRAAALHGASRDFRCGFSGRGLGRPTRTLRTAFVPCSCRDSGICICRALRRFAGRSRREIPGNALLVPHLLLLARPAFVLIAGDVRSQ